MGIIANAWQKLTGQPPKSKSTQARAGAGPALAAHSKDATVKKLTPKSKAPKIKPAKKKDIARSACDCSTEGKASQQAARRNPTRVDLRSRVAPSP
jgi:hypothetical protein